MRIEIKLHIVLGIWFVALPLYGQIDFSKYFDENSFPLLDPNDHLDPPFKWDMPGTIQVYLNEGINYLKEENPELAITNFDEALKRDSLLWVAYYYRGICNKNLFNLKKAEKDLLASLNIRPALPETYVELGEIYHMEDQFQRAAAQYEKAIAIDPQFVHAYYNLGSISLQKGDVRKGLKYYQKCNEINPKFPKPYMMQGIMKFKARKKDNESIPFFDKAIEADSTYALPYFWRGLAWISLERSSDALRDWNTLIRLQPENYLYTLLRACLYIELGDYDNAFNDLRKTIRTTAVDEERFTASQTILDKRIDLQYAANYLITNGFGLDERAFGFLKKGFCLLLAGSPKAALTEIKKAEEIEPSATVYFIEALAYEHAGDHNSAFQYYNKALRLDNDNFDAHKKRSVYRVELEDWKGANEDFKEMFRLQPNSPATYRLRGLAKSNQRDYRGAIEDLNQFIKTDSSDFESLRTRSVCLDLLGDKREANEDLRRLIRFEDGWKLYDEVADNYLSLMDTSNAIEVWQEYAALHPALTTPHMSLARIYILQKKWDSVRVEINKLMPLLNVAYASKDYAEVIYWDGLLDYEHSSYEKAIDKFSKSLKADVNNLGAKYFRAKAYEKTGQVKRAMTEFRELSASGYKDSDTLYRAVSQKQR
jgi:tetratricopeptide (TPR) repeat protein